MGFMGLIAFIVLIFIVWKVSAYAIFVHQTAELENGSTGKYSDLEKAQQELEKSQEELERSISDIKKTTLEAWTLLKKDYISSIEKGDAFYATAKGKRLYAFKRQCKNETFPEDVVADEIRIKEEVILRKPLTVNFDVDMLDYRAMADSFKSG